jgi:hypothetical protein
MLEDQIKELSFEKALDAFYGNSHGHSKAQAECALELCSADICVMDPRSQKRDLGHPILLSRRFSHTRDQKLNDICRSMLRFDEGDEKNPPARALDFPNRGDSSTPTGAARFTLLKIFLPIAVKVSE